jgi:hypothetical protein
MSQSIQMRLAAGREGAPSRKRIGRKSDRRKNRTDNSESRSRRKQTSDDKQTTTKVTENETLRNTLMLITKSQ